MLKGPVPGWKGEMFNGCRCGTNISLGIRSYRFLRQYRVRKPWPTLAGPREWYGGFRGKSTKSINVTNLPQGLLNQDPESPHLEFRAEDDLQYPAVVQGAKLNMARFEESVLLTRVGKFYEVRGPR